MSNNATSAPKPLVYLILGATGSGRREVIADFLTDSFAPADRPLVLLADTERPDAATDPKLAPIARWHWHDRGGGSEGLDGRIELAPDALPAANATHIFFITDGHRNPVDQIEAFKPWLATTGGELARVVCVVNCQLASQHREMTAWYDACIHFSDVVLLARRDTVPNKWISDFQSRYQDKFYPCVFDFVKTGRVRNPALVLEPEARRMSHYFDEPDYALADGTALEEGIDDEDSPQKRQTDDEIEITEQPDEYLARRAGGRRVKEIPDVAKLLA